MGGGGGGGSNEKNQIFFSEKTLDKKLPHHHFVNYQHTFAEAVTQNSGIIMHDAARVLKKLFKKSF